MSPSASRAENLAPLDAVLATGELERRTARQHDPEGHAEALAALARDLARDPSGALQKVCEAAAALCRADSAGISILQPGGERGVFRWHAVAGSVMRSTHATLPRDASPCGVVLDRDRPVLFDRPQRAFAALRALEPSIEEALFMPWAWHGEAIGTLWVLSHDAGRRFDAEDARLLQSLAGFAVVAWQLSATLDAARTAHDALQAEVAMRERAEQARRELLRRLLVAQEDERRRLSRKLHEQLGQEMSALGFKLAMLRQRTAGEPWRAELEHLEHLARDIDGNIDFVAWQLRPRALDDLGLVAALRDYVETWSRDHGVAVTLRCGALEAVRLDPLSETVLYRVAQELLDNVASEPHSGQIEIELERRASLARLTVRDEGNVFGDLGTFRERAQGHTLTGMQERVALFGGEVVVRASPGEGATIAVSLPLPPAA